MRRVLACAVLLLALPLVASAQQPYGLAEGLDTVHSGLTQARRLAEAGDLEKARAEVTRIYLDHYELIEGHYGPAGAHASELLSARIFSVEGSFHVLLRATDARQFAATASEIERAVEGLRADSKRAGVPLYAGSAERSKAAQSELKPLVTVELQPWATDLEAAQEAITAGDYRGALERVERVYLEGFEPLESRLPGPIVNRVERIVHLELRPALKSRATHSSASLLALRAELSAADAFLAQGGSFWFGAVNSFVIIVREGLEAVLLVGALLAYLAAMGASRRERMNIWLGVAGGLAATFATWIIATTLVPMSGASREVMEGVTALVAVAVLLYVSHWLFQKTYIHDWKEYLRSHLGSAVTRGSAAATAGLAFAAVYREGFETVLFYQALAFDVGGRAVLAGFAPGLVLITLVGWAIIRAGATFPIKRVFAISNVILMYLSFVFLGKGIFNLQESGLFAAHPIPWLPSHPALQQMMGFYPLAETVIAQMVLALALGSLFVFHRVRFARVARARASSPVVAAA